MELLDRFTNSHPALKADVLQDVKEYVQWRLEQGGNKFQPEVSDDVAIRTYMLEQHIREASQSNLDRIRSSLESFYTWLKKNSLVDESPFIKFNLKWPSITWKRPQPRHDAFSGSPGEREIERLRALNQLAEVTNRAPDVQSMLNGTLEILLGVMTLNTAWVSLKSDGGFISHNTGQPPEHGYVLAAVHNLPPSLEQSDRQYLRQPPACNCQKLLNKGRLKRGVNIVECSRLQEASKTRGVKNEFMFHASVPIICNDQAVGMMNFAAKEWQLLSASDLQFLTAGVRQVGAALERARYNDQIRIQHAHLKHELDMAHKVQVSLMPAKLPRIRGYSLAALWKPAYEMSGDYYNVYKLPGGCWGFMVIDVSDKGAPAALYMALTHGLIRERVENEESPAVLLAKVNRVLYDLDIKTNFVTAFYGILDPVKSILKYAVAGHPPPVLRTGSGKVKTLPVKGIALGIVADAVFEEKVLTLASGESLVIFSDGITDAVNPKGESFLIEQLNTVVRSAPANAKLLVKHVQTAVAGWVKEAPTFDDITLLVISKN
jgi:serine phosphatase RsbU (regulator of sigma subunit)